MTEAEVRATFRCLCGDVMVVCCSIEVLPEIRSKWKVAHSGDGHGAATSRQAASARKKAIKRQLQGKRR